MNLRLAGYVTLTAVLGAAVIGAVWLQRRAAEQRRIVTATTPRRPALEQLPAELKQRVISCEQRLQAGTDREKALAELSRLYHANGFYSEASQCYLGLMQLSPSNPRWPHRLASLLAGYGRLDDALPLWRRTVELAPEYVPGWLRLGDALLKTDKNKEAAEIYGKALKHDPQNPYALLGLARIDMAAAHWAEAKTALEKVVTLTDYRLGYDLLPTVYEQLGDAVRAEAVRNQNKASGAFFDTPDPWIDELMEDCYDIIRLAVAGGNADHSNDPTTAIHWLERAISLAPDSVPLLYQLGTHYVNQHEYDQARRYFERAVALAPDFSDGWIQLIVLLANLGDTINSERALAQGLSHCPDSPALHLEQARRLYKAGRYSEAIAEFQTSIRMRPQEADAYIELAAIYLRQGSIAEGIAQIHRALQAEPEHPTALTTLAFYAISTGNEAEARSWLHRIRLQFRISLAERQRLDGAFRKQFGRAPE